MNNTISEILKKLTICTMVLIFSFVLLAPTADALNYDPKNRKTVLAPSGDIDPWDEVEIEDPPPPGNFYFLTIITMFIFERYQLFINTQNETIIDREIRQEQSDKSSIN